MIKPLYINKSSDFDKLHLFEEWTNGMKVHVYAPLDCIVFYPMIMFISAYFESILMYLCLTFILLVYQWWAYDFLTTWIHWILLIGLFVARCPFIILWIIPLIHGFRYSIKYPLQIILFDVVMWYVFTNVMC